MPNNDIDKPSNVPVAQPQVSSAANAGSFNRVEPQAKPLAPVNLNNATTLNRARELFDEHSGPPKEPAPFINTGDGGPRELAAAENLPLARAQTTEKTEGEGGRQVNVPRPSVSTPARASAVGPIPTDPAGEGLAAPQPAGPADAATQTGGAVPPGLPPAPLVATCAERPKPTPSDNAPPPLLDVEEFIREAEDRKRGAKTLREIKAVADDIRQIRQRGVPFGAIHRGLKERGLVTCSRSRFDEICEDLFPDLIDPKRRGNA